MISRRENRIAVLIVSLAFLASGCRSIPLETETGLTVLNRSSHTVRIEMLRRIVFTDRSTTPWMREYQFYIHERDPLIIKPGEKKRIRIEDGYYGISLCDGLLCTARNFHKRGEITLIVEADKGRTNYRFVE